MVLATMCDGSRHFFTQASIFVQRRNQLLLLCTRMMCRHSSCVEVCCFPCAQGLRFCTPDQVCGLHMPGFCCARHSFPITIGSRVPQCCQSDRWCETFMLFCLISRPHSVMMAGLWSHPNEEESDGDMNMVGPEKSYGCGYVDGDMHLGPRKSYVSGLNRSSKFCSFGSEFHQPSNHSVSC